MNGSKAKLLNKAATGLTPRARRALKRLWRRTPAPQRAELRETILRKAQEKAAEMKRAAEEAATVEAAKEKRNG